MNPYRWKTEDAYFNNTETMNDYLDNHCEFDVSGQDGTYAEVIDNDGNLLACHAAGDGDGFNHIITFELL